QRRELHDAVQSFPEPDDNEPQPEREGPVRNGGALRYTRRRTPGRKNEHPAAQSAYASDEPRWRMRAGGPDSGMDENPGTSGTTEEMAGTDPATGAEQAVGE